VFILALSKGGGKEQEKRYKRNLGFSFFFCTLWMKEHRKGK